MKKLTTSSFIEKAKKVHGSTYIYDKVEYKGNKVNVCIICPIHGEFWQTPSNHLKGQGCPICRYVKSSNANRTPLERFLLKAHQVHGDKYDYSKVEYKNNSTKVCIICKEHGEFWQRPDKHLGGQGCPSCSGNKKYTFDDFVIKANNIHNFYYSYDKNTFIGMRQKTKIICPIHGEFWQTPHDHIQGQGCPSCGKNKIKKAKTSNTAEFIEKFNKLTNSFYDTSKINYVNNRTKVCVICPIHGEFWSSPNALLQGKGCPKCGKVKVSVNQLKYSTAEIVQMLQNYYGDKYSYDKVEYNGMSKKCIVTCPIHGDFSMSPNNLLKGHGCPKCGIEKNAKNRITPVEQVISEFQKIHNGKYKYDETTYVNKRNKMKMFCPKHGEFWQTPSNHLRGQGCPICKESTLEKHVAEFLTKNGIKYEREYPLKRQRLDFYISDYNLVIECQGIQHFMPKFKIGDKPIDFDEILERDIRKYKTLKDNNKKIIYFTEEKFVIDDIFTNSIFGGIYSKENVLTNLCELQTEIQKISDYI